MARKPAKFNFEDALENLAELVEAMEEGELSLEESLKAFEQGIKLTRECQVALENAEQKVQLLVNSDDIPEAEPFEEDENEA
ncbi:MAG: exodeoxyribonuclease VII small subunit [Gammaproteobacteria bacterium]|jgi:exodeoxyribonuclease VII small subunit|nr:exodeoxyribonuclease VII small subunit [Gammaproteobacteria bacterium]MDG1850881.1 exodeoxyribonuclease VII small subunit [Gammaproteobacteria bacterium]